MRPPYHRRATFAAQLSALAWFAFFVFLLAMVAAGAGGCREPAAPCVTVDTLYAPDCVIRFVVTSPCGKRITLDTATAKPTTQCPTRAGT